MAPATTAIDPTRKRFPENEEGPIQLMYGFLYVADKYEGLVIIGDASPKSKAPGVSTLLDGEPRNNFLRRALTWNEKGILKGARHLTIAGTRFFVAADAGLLYRQSAGCLDQWHPNAGRRADHALPGRGHPGQECLGRSGQRACGRVGMAAV